MRYICLGYFDETHWETMSQSEQNAFVDECLTYDDALQKDGHLVAAGEALQSARNAVTLRRKDGKVLVTDGPYAETKEQLGGFGVLEAADLDQADPADARTSRPQERNHRNPSRRGSCKADPGQRAAAVRPLGQRRVAHGDPTRTVLDLGSEAEESSSESPRGCAGRSYPMGRISAIWEGDHGTSK